MTNLISTNFLDNLTIFNIFFSVNNIGNLVVKIISLPTHMILTATKAIMKIIIDCIKFEKINFKEQTLTI